MARASSVVASAVAGVAGTAGQSRSKLRLSPSTSPDVTVTVSVAMEDSLVAVVAVASTDATEAAPGGVHMDDDGCAGGEAEVASITSAVAVPGAAASSKGSIILYYCGLKSQDDVSK